MSPEQIKEHCPYVIGILKAIAHPQRLMIMCYLLDGEKNVSELQEVCEISQSQISQFLNRMQRENILKVRKQGQFSYYSIANKSLVRLIVSLQKIFVVEKEG